uniref:Uncharacterized protein n=1 Tax=Anopheles atroparvus TaxID=41427 RepID=A0A182IQJ4_ANOAO
MSTVRNGKLDRAAIEWDAIESGDFLEHDHLRHGVQLCGPSWPMAGPPPFPMDGEPCRTLEPRSLTLHLGALRGFRCVVLRQPLIQPMSSYYTSSGSLPEVDRMELSIFLPATPAGEAVYAEVQHDFRGMPPATPRSCSSSSLPYSNDEAAAPQAEEEDATTAIAQYDSDKEEEGSDEDSVIVSPSHSVEYLSPLSSFTDSPASPVELVCPESIPMPSLLRLFNNYRPSEPEDLTGSSPSTPGGTTWSEDEDEEPYHSRSPFRFGAIGDGRMSRRSPRLIDIAERLSNPGEEQPTASCVETGGGIYEAPMFPNKCEKRNGSILYPGEEQPSTSWNETGVGMYDASWFTNMAEQRTGPSLRLGEEYSGPSRYEAGGRMFEAPLFPTTTGHNVGALSYSEEGRERQAGGGMYDAPWFPNMSEQHSGPPLYSGEEIPDSSRFKTGGGLFEAPLFPTITGHNAGALSNSGEEHCFPSSRQAKGAMLEAPRLSNMAEQRTRPSLYSGEEYPGPSRFEAGSEMFAAPLRPTITGHRDGAFSKSGEEHRSPYCRQAKGAMFEAPRPTNMAEQRTGPSVYSGEEYPGPSRFEAGGPCLPTASLPVSLSRSRCVYGLRTAKLE